MKVLLLGATGLLGCAIKDVFDRKGEKVVGVARNDADYIFDLRDKESLAVCISQEKPDVVINAAAMVSLTACERNPLDAYEINTCLPENAAKLCKQKNIYFLHISTDHYFSGDGRKKHNEEAEVILLNEYAKTKYLGERLTVLHNDSLIIRTNFVGFGNGKRPNFLRWAVNSLLKKEPMILYDDFVTSSIAASQLAEVIHELMLLHCTGLLNVASEDVKSKKEFILGLAERLGITNFPYITGSVHENKEVTRAESLGLDVNKVEKIIGRSLPSFKEVLDVLIKEIEHEISYYYKY